MKFIEFTPEQQAEFDKWVAERPPFIRGMIKRCPPDRLYSNGAGHRVTILSYEEDGTVTVAITGQYNKITFERNVFGVPIEDLQECDLPGKDELLGAILTKQEDIDAFINATRSTVLARNH